MRSPFTRRTRSGVRKAVAAVAVVGTLAGGITACSSSSSDLLSSLKSSGKVNVGFANERPYAYLGSGGALVGEAPAISGAILDKIGGIKLQPQLFDFGSLIQALNSKRVDMVTAGMFITPQRCKVVDFGNPEYIATEALLVPKGNPKNLTDFTSVKNNPNVRLAVMNGAVEQQDAQGYGIPDGQVQIVADQQSGLDAVKSGRADAFALTSISLRSLANSDSSVQVSPGFVPVINGKQQLGVGAAVFRKGDDKLRDAYNAELAKLIASGEWLKLVAPYGFTAAEMPKPGMTADQFCKG